MKTVPRKNRYHNSTFENIPEQKRLKVLKIVATELASAGLTGARMKEIARTAEVSYGSLYNYFPTKDDMIRTTIQEGRVLQEQILTDFRKSNQSFFEKLEMIIERTQQMARESPEMIAVWVELSHSYNARFADDIMDLEEDGAHFWLSLIEAAVQSGELDKQTDIQGAAFCIDNALSALLKSDVSSVQTKRMTMFFKEPGSRKRNVDDSRVRNSLMKTFRAMLT